MIEEQKKKVILFDVDDTLWGLNDKICAEYGINKDNIVNFYFDACPNITYEDKEILLSGYRNPNNYKNIKWFTGVDKVNDLAKLKEFEVCIKSNNLSSEVRENKLASLRQVIKEECVSDENVYLDLVETDSTSKIFHKDVDILIDDSPFNHLSIKPKLAIMISQPWNSGADVDRLLQSNGIEFVRFQTFEECISYLFRIKEDI